VEKYMKIYAEHFGLRYTILRYGNVYGNNQLLSGEGGVVAIFIDNLFNNRTPVIFGTGDQNRDFIFVKDVAKANLLALTYGNNEIFNISTHTATTINDLLVAIGAIVNKDAKSEYRPFKDGDILHSVLDNFKAKELLKWEPLYSLTEGLNQTIKDWEKPKRSDTLT